ncbi:lycopene cyclase family protein [Cellulomonas hominis]
MSTATGPPAALPERCDALIIGGGAAGLALPARLADSEFRHRRVIVVDDDSWPLADRAWAYWSDATADTEAVGAQAFDRFWVCTGDAAHLVELDRFRYRTVTGPELDRATDAALAGAPGFARVRGQVSAVSDGPHGASVVVDGRTVRADWVFDSVGVRDPTCAGVGLPIRAAGPGHRLVFTGRRIETDVGVLDPCAPVLRDFRTGQGADLAFVYVLPAGPRVALVEHTRFTAADVRPGASDTALDAYLRDVLRVGTHRVLAPEHGTLPLVMTRPPRPGHRVVRIGTPAGMVRASIGYGYARIQRHSAALARSLATHGHPFDVPDAPARYRTPDHVLLEVIDREPARVVDVFARLFAASPGDRVLEFLDERTSVAQEFALIRTLPPAPFLRAVAAPVTRPPSERRTRRPRP